MGKRIMTGCCNRVQLVFTILGIMAWVILWGPLSEAQFQTEPHPLDSFLSDILDFQKPTGIRGTLRYIDLEGQIIWLNWEARSDDRPFFQSEWKPVPGEATLAVHPKDLKQFNELQRFGKGSAIEMVIQLDPEGKRRILSYHDLSLPPKFQMKFGS